MFRVDGVEPFVRLELVRPWFLPQPDAAALVSAQVDQDTEAASEIA